MVVAILFVDNFIFGASAASNYDVIDYNDYTGEMYFDGVGERVKVSFPSALNYFEFKSSDPAPYQWFLENRGTGLDSFTFNKSYLGAKAFNLIYRPTGFSLLDLRNIPDSSALWIDFDPSIYVLGKNGVLPVAWNRVLCEFTWQLYDADFNVLGVHTLGHEAVNGVPNGYIKFNNIKVENLFFADKAAYAMFRVSYLFQPDVNTFTSDYIFNCRFPSFDIELGISSYYRYLEQQQITNGYLDSIVNGNQGASDSVVSGMEGSGLDLENLNKAMEISKPTIDSSNFITAKFVHPAYVNSLTAPFKVLWQNPTLTAMLVIVSSLVLVSFVFFGSKR